MSDREILQVNSSQLHLIDSSDPLKGSGTSYEGFGKKISERLFETWRVTVEVGSSRNWKDSDSDRVAC